MYLVSSCLAGVNCRYDGRNSENKVIVGLPTQRPCCEIVIYESDNKKVISKEGQDFTKEFIEGAERALAIAKVRGIKSNTTT